MTIGGQERSNRMKVKIGDICINERKRKLNAAKVAELAESFTLLGQLEPIIVSPNGERYVLLAGLHRIEAAKLLGWQTIEAVPYQGDELERELVEIDENLIHNDLTILEQGEQLQRRNEILEAMGKRAKQGDNQFDIRGGETVSPLKTTEDIAKEAGLSKRSAQQRIQIARNISPEVKELIRNTPIADSTRQLLELARIEPDEQIEIAKQSIERKIAITEAKREIAKEKQKNAPKPELPDGKYSVIYIDPPWPVGSIVMDKWKSPIEDKYPTMTIDEIRSLPIDNLAGDECSLFMWTTHTFLPDALKIINEWGFKYFCCITWDKGNGWTQLGFHKRTEFLLYAYKGGINVNQYGDAIPTIISEKKTYHSKKPDSIRDLIAKKTPEPRLEMFARGKYEGWIVWGNEVNNG